MNLMRICWDVWSGSNSLCVQRVESCESGAAVHATRPSRESAVPKCGSAVGVERPALVLSGKRSKQPAFIWETSETLRTEIQLTGWQRPVSAAARSIALKIQRADITGVTGDGWRREALMGEQLIYHRPSKHGASYKKVQAKVYNFLERPTGKGLF